MSTTLQVNFEKIPVSDLTEAKLDGKGVYDILMRANKEYLQQEYEKDRIKGVEYSTVYLGLQEPTMRVALEFLLQQQKAALEAASLEKQILLADAELEKAKAAIELSKAQVEIAHIEADIARENLKKLPEEIEQIKAQTELIKQQKVNLTDELLTSAVQRTRLTEEVAQTKAQTNLLGQQLTNAKTENTQALAQIELIKQNTANALTQNTTMLKEQCKLDAEFDLLQQQVLKAGSEIGLLNQKVNTEKAQTVASGVDPDSVIGKQKALYTAQTDGFKRDAELNVAKALIDTWQVRRSSDEGTQANTTNKLDDGTIGRAVNKMLQGVGV